MIYLVTTGMLNRELKRGSIELIILALLDERERHGYQIGKMIEERSRGELTFRVHSLYPRLLALQEEGMIASRWVDEPGQRRRRFYRLTPLGRETLQQHKDRWRRYVLAVDRVIGEENA